MVPLSATFAAFAAVCLEEFGRRNGWLKEEAVPHEFIQSAKRLVGQAFARRVWLLRLWRWLEVLTAVFWFGFALLVMNCIWWLPLVALAYSVPAACLYGGPQLLSAPALAIMTRGTAAQAAFMLSLFKGLVSARTCGYNTVEAVALSDSNPPGVKS